MGVSEVNDATIGQAIASGNVVVDCYTSWCGPCKQLTPALQAMSARLPHIRFYKINVETSPIVSRSYGIQGVPTLLFFRNGQLVGRVTGFGSAAETERTIRQYLG